MNTKGSAKIIVIILALVVLGAVGYVMVQKNRVPTLSQDSKIGQENKIAETISPAEELEIVSAYKPSSQPFQATVLKPQSGETVETPLLFRGEGFRGVIVNYSILDGDGLYLTGGTIDRWREFYKDGAFVMDAKDIDHGFFEIRVPYPLPLRKEGVVEVYAPYYEGRIRVPIVFQTIQKSGALRADTNDWKLYRNNEEKFVIKYPVGWMINAGYTPSFTAFGRVPGFRTLLAISSRLRKDISKNYSSLDQYISEFSIDISARYLVDGHPAAQNEGCSVENNRCAISTYILNNGRIYNINTGFDGEVREEHREFHKLVISTFRFLDK
ncbi:MAG: hypothetical protein Q8R20_03465 [Nanoarchaeota archaeon]|nr:hypothetical protein [Nanoarchaeota archaeon]